MDETAEHTGRGRALQPLRHRSFRLLWFGQLTSQVGDWIAFVALTSLVWDLTQSGRWVAALRATHAVPILLLGPLAGVFVDRWNRRATMLTVDLVRTGLMAALAASGSIAATLDLTQLTTILGLSIIFELASLLFAPAKNATIPHLVPPEALLAANTLSATTGTVSLLLGPVLGGLALATAGVGGALVLDAATFAVSAAAIAALDVPHLPRAIAPAGGRLRRVLSELRAGLRYVRGERVVLVTIALEGVLMLGWGTISILGVVLAERRLALDERGYGALLAAFGAGSLLGSLVVGPLERRASARVTLAGGFVLVAAGICGLAAAQTLPPALCGYAVAGLGQMIVSVVGLTLLQRVVREDLRGRAFSIYNTVSHGMILLANQGAASLADLVAVAPTLMLAGGCQLLGAAGAAFLLPPGAQTGAGTSRPATAPVATDEGSAAASPGDRSER